MFTKKIISICLFSSVLLSGCYNFSSQTTPDKITSINIIDRNGMSETLSSKDRLIAFQKTDFLSPQPYQKVLRVFGRDKGGNICSRITSYHPNGQVKQHLEANNNRAHGPYQEWYANGQLKVKSSVVGGVADLNTQAEESWIFDGHSKAWDEDGHLLADIFYNKGALEGEATYYHPNGQVWKISPFIKNQKDGIEKIYLEDGTLFHTTQYLGGTKEGPAVRYWGKNEIAFQEVYQEGSLIAAQYFDKKGEQISEIHDGTGYRAIFGKSTLQELQEFRSGVQEGSVKIYDENRNLIRAYSTKNGEKEGEEIDYFPSIDGSLNSKLLITWRGGTIEGPVKTWYDNGNFESQREISQNKKNGLSTAWYYSGALMFVEEYDNDLLVKGEYYREGETSPFSLVERGNGIASLFNPDGNFSKKVHYLDGKPLS